MTARNGRKASEFLAERNALITALQSVDAEIDQALKNPHSQRAAQRARVLFQARAELESRLWQFGVETDPHPAVDRIRFT